VDIAAPQNIDRIRDDSEGRSRQSVDEDDEVRRLEAEAVEIGHPPAVLVDDMRDDAVDMGRRSPAHGKRR
jgi:hypothetical protein